VARRTQQRRRVVRVWRVRQRERLCAGGRAGRAQVHRPVVGRRARERLRRRRARRRRVHVRLGREAQHVGRVRVDKRGASVRVCVCVRVCKRCAGCVPVAVEHRVSPRRQIDEELIEPDTLRGAPRAQRLKDGVRGGTVRRQVLAGHEHERGARAERRLGAHQLGHAVRARGVVARDNKELLRHRNRRRRTLSQMRVAQHFDLRVEVIQVDMSYSATRASAGSQVHCCRMCVERSQTAAVLLSLRPVRKCSTPNA